MKEQIAKGKSKKLKQVAEEHTRETHNPKRIDKTKEEMLIITKKKKPEALKLLREDGKLYIEISKIEGIPTELRINGFICRVIMEREYSIPPAQTAQEVIGYYARRITQNIKLPSQFAVLAPKVTEFFEHKAFGKTVDLNDKNVILAISSNIASYVVIKEFEKAGLF